MILAENRCPLFRDHACAQPKRRPEPPARKAANRIKEAAPLGKQERGFFRDQSPTQAFDIP